MFLTCTSASSNFALAISSASADAFKCFFLSSIAIDNFFQRKCLKIKNNIQKLIIAASINSNFKFSICLIII